MSVSFSRASEDNANRDPKHLVPCKWNEFLSRSGCVDVFFSVRRTHINASETIAIVRSIDGTADCSYENAALVRRCHVVRRTCQSCSGVRSARRRFIAKDQSHTANKIGITSPRIISSSVRSALRHQIEPSQLICIRTIFDAKHCSFFARNAFNVRRVNAIINGAH